MDQAPSRIRRSHPLRRPNAKAGVATATLHDIGHAPADGCPPMIRARRIGGALALLLGIGAARLTWADTRVTAPAGCPSGHECVVLPHATLAIPEAYARSTLPGAAGLGRFDPSVSYFAFWMPGGVPAGDVKDAPFFLCPDCRNAHLTSAPRTLVSVTLVPLDEATGDPDRSFRVQVAQTEWERAHHKRLSRPITAKQASDLVGGTTPLLADIDATMQLPLDHWIYGRQDCDALRCRTHYELRRPVKVPYPPFVVLDGPMAMSDLEMHAYVETVWRDPAWTQATMRTLSRLVRSWIIVKH